MFAQERGRRTASSPCSGCALHHLCIPAGIDRADFDKLGPAIRRFRSVRRGQPLYRMGDIFRSLYSVRAGSFKSMVAHRDGRDHVTAFHLVGETLGADGICADQYACDVIALEDSLVCIMPFELIELLCREVASVQRHVHRIMSAEIVREAGLLMMLATMNADERLAAFLLNISARLQRAGYSPAEFHLRMTRDEMGSYLGLQLETVSRSFSNFQKASLIEVRGKQINIVDRGGLEHI
ncbi:helix-turn-helix domain-containing protein [Caballeronia sordidicola]|uniref:helix-turn-helix domain-containing protein n=1 Tax=Caballeronia sordidicola TaxID=196367 RepID=UPI003AF330F8